MSSPTRLLAALRLFFRQAAPAGPGDRILVAFSGGADSTALLWGLAELARRGELAPPLAAHLDHALDPGSAERARGAARLAAALGVPLVAARREVAAARGGESLEAAARRARYEFLEEVRRRAGARWVATAHHRDDQAETVVLRLLFGSGLAGLAAILPRRGAVVRPLLTLPKETLAAAAAAAGLEPLDDPTNADLRVPRNRVRRLLLPALAAEDPDLPERLALLAARARGARAALERRLGNSSLQAPALAALPDAAAGLALALLHARAGAEHPAGAGARRELRRQLRRQLGRQLGRQLEGGGAVGCDCGAGWRWETAGREVVLRPRRPRPETPAGFAYTLEVPGELAIPEIGVRLSVRRGAVEPWMWAGSCSPRWARRAGLALPLAAGDRLTVRSRRPGDRLRPLGGAGSRRLKDLLIDRRVPRESRDRLPLVCVDGVGGAIAWVPGVAIDERFRVGTRGETWIAELSADDTLCAPTPTS